MTPRVLHVGALFSAAMILSAACGGEDVSEADKSDANAVVGTVGGNRAVVALTVDGQVFCSGVVIAERVVATAASCFANWKQQKKPIDAKVRIGLNATSNTKTKEVGIEEIRIAPELCGTKTASICIGKAGPSEACLQQMDLALIRLKENAGVKELKIYQTASAPQGLKSVRVVGYGCTGAGKTDAGTKHTADVPLKTWVGNAFLETTRTSACGSADLGGGVLVQVGKEWQLAGVIMNGGATAKPPVTQATLMGRHMTPFVTPFMFKNNYSTACVTDNFTITSNGTVGGGTSTGGGTTGGSCTKSGGSCQGSCGQYDASWACQCDENCASEGDCCPDAASLCQISCPSTPTGQCAHDECTTGGPLTSSCSECVKAICAIDSYCCTTNWDNDCIGLTESACSPACSEGYGD